jgi:hypothetical protein
MCCSISCLMTPLKCSNTSAGSLPYIPNFENKGTNLMIANIEKNTCKKFFKFVLDYKFGAVPCTYSLFRNQSQKFPTSGQLNFVENSTFIFCTCTILSSLPSIS